MAGKNRGRSSKKMSSRERQRRMWRSLLAKMEQIPHERRTDTDLELICDLRNALRHYTVPGGGP